MDMKYIWMFILIAIAVLMLTIGSYILFAKVKYDAVVNAEVTSVKCRTESKTNNCSIELSYKDNKGKDHKENALVTGPITVGQTMTIRYDSVNPSNFYPGNPPVRMVGGIIALVGFVIMGGVALWFSLSRKKTTLPSATTTPTPPPASTGKSTPPPAVADAVDDDIVDVKPTVPITKDVKDYADNIVDTVIKQDQ
jgi:hypothetical protein